MGSGQGELTTGGENSRLVGGAHGRWGKEICDFTLAGLQCPLASNSPPEISEGLFHNLHSPLRTGGPQDPSHFLGRALEQLHICLHPGHTQALVKIAAVSGFPSACSCGGFLC